MSSRWRWWWRVAAAAALFAGLEVALRLLNAGPDPVRLGLLVGLGVAAVSLLVDAVPVESAPWRVRAHRPVTPSGQDPRTASYLRLLESHRTAREPDGALRDRIGELADQVLRVRHDMTRRDPRADELLGPDVVGVISGPPRRLGADELERCVSRIEDL